MTSRTVDPIVGDIPSGGARPVREPAPKPKVVTRTVYRDRYRIGYSLRAVALAFGLGAVCACLVALIGQVLS